MADRPTSAGHARGDLNTVPRVGITDDTIAFWREGYTYISSRCDALGSDVFRSRLLLKPVVCARGADAAATFYGTNAFTRTGAMPKSAQHLLQDEESVQDLDAAQHAQRKQMFLPMLDAESVETFAARFRTAWDERASRWRAGDRVQLYGVLNSALTEAAMSWVGLPSGHTLVRRRCHELTAMISNAGSVGPRNWWARLLRRRSERWAAAVIDDIRSGHVATRADDLAGVIAAQTEDGARLESRVAAVELLNVLRPIVAISRFAVFAAVALWTFPGWRERVRSGDDKALACFVQEVRRFYPFFPVVGGKSLRKLDFAGHRLPAGTWVLLDLYGTNHDRRAWTDPHAFRPERFEDQDPGAYAFVPQGGGEYATGHRCPGEAITVGAVAEVVRLLADDRYALPAQDLTIDLAHMPALPRSGVLLQRR